MKYLIAVADGMADEPQPALAGKTPLQAARTPRMDYLARNGTVGLLRTVPAGMPPGSDVANLSLFGYSPLECYTGRAPLEAASLGIAMGADDLAFRCNLVRIEQRDGQEIMADYSGGGIATKLARPCIQALNDHLPDPRFSFHPGVSYRHVLLWKDGRKLFEGLRTTPPHDISGRQIDPFLPRGPGSAEVRDLMARGSRILETGLSAALAAELQGKANALWLWGEGPRPRMSGLTERFGIRGVTVCAVDLIKGLGRYAGLQPVEVEGATGDLDTNYRGKASAVLEALRDVDLAFLHVEAPDEASHRGDLNGKIEAIERFDEEVVAVVHEGLMRTGLPFRILLCPDHPTPLKIRTHSSEPVPFLLFTHPASAAPTGLARRQGSGAAASFDESAALSTGVLIEEGHRIVDLLLQGARSS
ncbi:MAG: cofactor-independent phosphoglycerate mutase [bacterium]